MPQQLLAGPVEVLTGEPVDVSEGYGLLIPTDFNDAVQIADAGFAAVPIDLTDFAEALSLGDIGRLQIP
jgi:hypothetical protein